jgi:hypothetical protein
MKKLTLTLGLMTCLTFTGFGQAGHGADDGHNHDAPAAQPAATSLAEIKMDKTTHDYGNIKQGDNGECEFKFTNVGKEPLVITNCQGSCGCTVPQCPREPILPGKSGVVKVKYDTNRVGGIYKTVTVTSNSKTGNVVLTIKGNVEAKPVEETFPQNNTPAGAPVEKKS